MIIISTNTGIIITGENESDFFKIWIISFFIGRLSRNHTKPSHRNLVINRDNDDDGFS